MKKQSKRPPDGEIRQSQLLTTFGPGSMVDLPERSVVISGLSYWHGNQKPITEERLRYKVNKLIEQQTGSWKNLELLTPPQPYQSADSRQHRIEAFVFPQYFLGQVLESYGKYRTRPLRHWNALKVDKKFNGEKTEWVPIRFVQSCVNGHLSDIDWKGFVHADLKTACSRQLWLDEAGSGNDFEEIFVRCECGVAGDRSAIARLPWRQPDQRNRADRGQPPCRPVRLRRCGRALLHGASHPRSFVPSVGDL